MPVTDPERLERPGRRRGGVAVGLDRAQIVEAARGIPPEQLTMQAVADRLGVDRKALNYHVSDRESLRGLVAIDAFETHFSGIEISTDSWQSACRAFGLGVADALITTGHLAGYFTMGAGALQATETVLELMSDAGFDDETARRGLVMLATVAMGYGRDRLVAIRFGAHPQVPETERALAAAPDGLAALRRVGDLTFDPFDEAQLHASIDTFLLGMEERLYRLRIQTV